MPTSDGQNTVYSPFGLIFGSNSQLRALAEVYAYLKEKKRKQLSNKAGPGPPLA
jgi:catalase (peroxidase I)